MPGHLGINAQAGITVRSLAGRFLLNLTPEGVVWCCDQVIKCSKTIVIRPHTVSELLYLLYLICMQADYSFSNLPV